MITYYRLVGRLGNVSRTYYPTTVTVNLTTTTAIRRKVTKPINLELEPNDHPDTQQPTTTASASNQPGKGKIYDKKPFKFACVQGKVYSWCSCGFSKKQPFCDGSHKLPQLKIDLKPLKFTAPETKDYLFCNCKQTSKPPFCDGTHKREDIQAAIIKS